MSSSVSSGSDGAKGSTLDTHNVAVPSVLVYLAVYAFTIIGGIVALLVAGNDKRLRYHGMQALLLGVVILVAYYLMVLGIGALGVLHISPIASLITLLIWLYGLYVGYKAGTSSVNISIPVIGNAAKNYAHS